ncbi:MAG: HU family DNA-binding protein [Bacteroidaceae bacterium]
MIKKELIKEISDECNVSLVDCSKVVETAMVVLSRAFVNSENIFLRGFGTFDVKKSRKKIARNISTGETINLPDHNVVKFKLSKEIKNKI